MDTFESTVRPVIAANCMSCHNDKLNTGGLSLERYTSADAVLRDREKWELVRK